MSYQELTQEYEDGKITTAKYSEETLRIAKAQLSPSEYERFKIAMGHILYEKLQDTCNRN